MVTQIDWLSTIQLVFLIIGPITLMTTIYFVSKEFGYLLKKWWRGTKGIRLFYFGPNGGIITDFISVGTNNHDSEIKYKDRSYVFDRNSLFMLPKDFPKYGGERCLFVRYDNAHAFNPFDVKNTHSSKMFNTIIESKLAEDFAKDDTSWFDSIKMEHVMMLGVIAIGIYLIAGRFMGGAAP